MMILQGEINQHPEKDLVVYDYLIYDKLTFSIYWEKFSLINDIMIIDSPKENKILLFNLYLTTLMTKHKNLYIYIYIKCISVCV